MGTVNNNRPARRGRERNKRFRTWRTALALLTCVGVLAVAGCSSGGDASSATGTGTGSADAGQNVPTIRVAGNQFIGVVPVFVAMEHGFFKKHGVAVKWVPTGDIGTLPNALNKSVDIAMSTQTLLIAAANHGQHVVEVASQLVNVKGAPQLLIVVRKDSGITSLSDLQGKTIAAASLSGTNNTATMFALHQAGVDLKSVRVVQTPIPQMEDQLKAKTVDAVGATAPYTAQFTDNSQYRTFSDPYNSVAPAIQMTDWISNSSWAKSHAEQIAAFKAGLQDAIDYMKANPDEALATEVSVTSLPKALLQKAASPTFSVAPRPGDLAKWFNAMKVTSGFSGSADPSELIYK